MSTTLLVDGDNLLTIGFHGLKNYFYKGKHIGAIFHFLNTLRRSFETYHLDKIVVFWDGENGNSQRREIYPLYKYNSNKKVKSDEEKENYLYQRHRVKRYLEEVYVRQGEYPLCETDDNIAFYIQNSPNEKKIIFSTDGDLVQFVSENVQFYHPIRHILYGPKDKYIFEHEEILIGNVKLAKMICGDPSDSIYGITNLGIKRFIGLFPEVVTQNLTLEYIRNKAQFLIEQDDNNKTLQNLLAGECKSGIIGEDFYKVNSRLVDLSVPFVTEEAKEGILSLINDNLDTEGRSYKNTMKMMVEDGIFTVLPKSDDAWINFLNPFLRLTRKEKNKHVFKYTRKDGHKNAD